MVTALLFIDFYIPGKEQPIEELESFHSTQRYFSGRYGSRGYELINSVELKNGTLYRIGKQPLKDYKSGQKIKIIKSLLFGKVNEVLIFDKKWEYLYVGFIYKEIILALLLVTIGLAIASRRFNHPILDLSFVASILYLFITFVTYLLAY